MVDVKVINPFLESARDTIAQVGQVQTTIGKPCIERNLSFTDDNVIVSVGIVGAVKGTVMIVIPEATAKIIASNMMMGMPVESLDDMALSALAELGNMTMGHASTLLASNGVETDITPPVIQKGIFLMDSPGMIAITVPLQAETQSTIRVITLIK